MSDTASPEALSRRLAALSDRVARQPSAWEQSAPGRAVSNVVGGARMMGSAIASGVHEAFTGTQRRTGNFEEFQPWDADIKGGLAAAFANSSAEDPVGYAAIMKNWLPGSDVSFDANNNPLIKWNGKTYYANKPGISGNDVGRLVTDMASYWPAARWASAAKSALGAGGKAATGSALTNWLQQAGAQVMGSGQPINIGSMALAGVGGMGGELLSELMTPAAMSLRYSLGRGSIVSPNGSPTAFGRQFVESAGVDPDAMPLEAWRTLDDFYSRMDRSQREMVNAAGGSEAARATAAGAVNSAMEANRNVIPKTLGQQTRGEAQLDTEELMRTGRMGEPARTAMGAFDQGQTQAVMRRADDLQRTAGGGQIRSQTPEALGSVVSEGVRGAEQRAWNAVGEAYDAVPTGVRLAADPLVAIPNAATASLRNMGIFPDRAGFETVYPRTAKILNDVRVMLSEKMSQPPSRRSFGLMELEQERRAINMAMNGAEGADMTALQTLKSTFDEYVEKTWDDALINGDETALEQLKLARQARTEYARQFEPKDVDRTVNTTIQRMVNMPDVDNNAVINWVFGATESGFGKAGLQMVKQLKSIFGPGSNEFNALREAAMMKVIYGTGSNPMRDAAWNSNKVVSKSSQQLLRRLDNYLDLGGSQVMRELFTKPELDQLRMFRYELRQIQPGENAATMRTGASMPVWMNRVGSWVDGLVRVKAGGLPVAPMEGLTAAAQGLSNRAQAAAAVGGWRPPRVRSIPIMQSLLTAGAIGAGNAGYGAPQTRQLPGQPPPQ